MTITVQSDRMLVRAAGGSTRHVLVGFEAPEAPGASGRQPVNVALVIDRSGSMGGAKIALARDAVIQALRMLRPADRFSVVIYDNEVDVVVPSTTAEREAIANAITVIWAVKARGSTNLGGGWLAGCEQLAAHLRDGQVARAILLSDGLANQGITDPDALNGHAAELRQRGVTTSTIGLGADFDERLLAGLAKAGGGHFYYVESAVQIADCLTGELGEALEVVAHDARVVVRPAPGVAVESLNDFPVVSDSGELSVRLGDLVSRQDVALVLRLTFPEGAEGATALVVFGLADARGALREPDTDILWTFAGHAANDAQPRNVEVDRAVAALYAARAQAEALELNRSGDYERARRRLSRAADRIASYAGSDAALLHVVDQLRESDAAFAAPMSPADMKAAHFRSTSVSQMRSDTGKARRKG